MTDDEIRSIVRQVLSARGAAHPPALASVVHPSTLRLHMVLPTEPGSPCVIEPAVTCNNCGYCLSQGH